MTATILYYVATKIFGDTSTFMFQVGGELYFSDVYTNEELPEAVRKNKVFWGRFVRITTNIYTSV